MENDETMMNVAIELSLKGMLSNEGGPFGAIITQNNKIIGRGNNRVTSSNDPTAHAEVNAIRDACKNIGNFELIDCVLYTSCEPCPMCLGAIYWARIPKVYYACSRSDAANIGFDDALIYKEISLPIEERMIAMNQICQHKAIEVFNQWDSKVDKTKY